MLIQPAVQEIENLGEMMCVSTHTNARVSAKEFSREVEPPYSIVRFPRTLDTRDVVLLAAAFRPVEDHQMFHQSGLVLIKPHSPRLPHTVPHCRGQCICRQESRSKIKPCL